MYKLELFTRVRSPYIWQTHKRGQTHKRANAPDIVNRQQVKGPLHRLSLVHKGHINIHF